MIFSPFESEQRFFICSILKSTFAIYLYALIQKNYLKHLRVSLPTVCSRQARQTFKSKEEQKSQILLKLPELLFQFLEHDGSGSFSFYCRINMGVQSISLLDDCSQPDCPHG